MILSAIFGLIFGIGFGSLLHFPLWLTLTIFVLSVILFLYRYSLEGKNKLHTTFLAIFLLFTLLGVGRISFSDLYQKSSLTEYANKRIVAEGVVVEEPDVRESKTNLTVELQKIIEDDKADVVKENVLVSIPIYPEYFYGDKLKLNLTLEAPKNFETNGREFDYVGYLRARGVWYTAKYAKVELLSNGNGNFLETYLFEIKNAFKKSINNTLPEPESSLLNGVLLGAKQSLGKEWLTRFQKTGTSHIVVLSGYNIAIVADYAMSALKIFPENISFSFGVLSIILFTILSGGGASAVRAAIMVIVALFAKKYNRDYKAGRALGFAVLLLLAPNPLLLVFDPSFELSVLATIGLVFVTPIVSSRLKFVTEKFGLRETISATLGTQMTTLPLLLYTNGLFSLVSLPVNVIVLPFIPTIMFLGFFTGIFGLVSLYLSFIPGFFAYGLLWYVLKVIELGSSLPFSSIKIPAFSLPVLFGIYIVISIYIFLAKRKTI